MVWFLCGGTLPAEEAQEPLPPPTRAMTAEDISPEELASIHKPDPERKIPYRPGTKLTYKVGWGWFSVGEATMEFGEEHFGDQLATTVELQARTNRFADAFYKVRNRTKTWIAEDFSQTIHYENSQHEGSRHREVIVVFDWEHDTVQYSNTVSNDVREPVKILPGTFDPLGITFYVGSLSLEIGKTLTLPSTNGKEFFLSKVAVTGRETRKFEIGKRESIILQPSIKDLGGVFRKRENSSIKFWFTADGSGIPLRMESEVAVGSFWAELQSIEYSAPES